jgi:hypothetical protein
MKIEMETASNGIMSYVNINITKLAAYDLEEAVQFIQVLKKFEADQMNKIVDSA